MASPTLQELIDQIKAQNVSQFGPIDSTVNSYKEAAEYAAEAKDWADLCEQIYLSLKDANLEDIIQAVTDAKNSAAAAATSASEAAATEVRIQESVTTVDEWIQDMSVTPFPYTGVGGETTIVLPEGFREVQVIYLNGGRQERGDDFLYDLNTRTITLMNPLFLDDRVTVLSSTIYEQTSTLAQTLSGVGGADYVKTGDGDSVQNKLNGLYWTRTVEMFGTIGDGITDDSFSIQSALNWVTSGSYRKLIFSSNKIYYHTQPLIATFNTSNSVGCEITMIGSLFPAKNVGDALTIQEATYCSFLLKVKGDGYNIETIPDYSQADPEGSQQAFVINSCRGCKVSVEGYGYAGRVLRTKGGGVTKMSFVDISLKTGEGSCGQAAFLQATSDAYGRISHAQTQWDYYGSVLDKLTDVTISYWEYGNKNSRVPAMLINNCGSVSIGNLTGGSAWDSDTSTTLKIIGGQGIHASRLQVGEAYSGLIIEGNGLIKDKPTVVIDYLISYKTNKAVTLNNTTGVQIKSGICDNTYYGVVYEGNIYNCKVNMNGRNNFTSMHFADTGVLIDSLSIGGGMYAELSSAFISMFNATVNDLFILDTYVNTLGRYVFLPASNQCTIIGGRWLGSTHQSPIANRPKFISNVVGVNTKYINASLNFTSGSPSGTSVTINHGLWSTPYEISITPYNVSSSTTFSSGNLVLKSLTSSQVVISYNGTSPLSSDMYLVVELKAEARPD